ncbi:PREDICTED: WD repeat-containing protein 78-like [Nicrophorus vespilloides]|uniref:Dynein axonemal intermediate chain 4 n=1 Tax=Nicrophorus vespilloides TaxID=110193 RepID=A0ABM1N511_NICVS|nr:PREDICTED: WD repeat-containing protein 78-like [Nicrophorus vespilloides]
MVILLLFDCLCVCQGGGDTEMSKDGRIQMKMSPSKNSSHVVGTSSKSTAPKSILTSKVAATVKIIHYGVDVTPRFINPLNYKGAKERPMTEMHVIAAAGGGGTFSKLFHTESTLKLQSELRQTSTRGESFYGGGGGGYSNFSTEPSHVDNLLNSEESFQPQKAYSEGYLTPLPDVDDMPGYISLTLHETDTIIIFEMGSATATKDTPEGIEAEAENKQYEYITVGKGKNRKVVDAEVQTTSVLQKSRETDCKRMRQADDYSFASLWDMYDTFQDQGNAKKNVVSVLSSLSVDSIATNKEEREWLALTKSDVFQDAVRMMQRILSNNVFGEEQKRFRGLNDPSPFRENIEFKYTLSLMWTFSNDDTKGRCVTCLCWNPKNKDILAVGYGKFFYDDETDGLVLLWNIKNNVQPERYYSFPTPVTSLDFSKQYPNLLAVGFYDGFIKVLDVSHADCKLMGVCDKQACQLFEPIWQVHWYTDHDYYKGQEFLAATCQDGKIFKFCINLQNVFMLHSHMMKITIAEGKLKGIETLRKCTTKIIPLARHSPALIYSPHPVDPNIYYIGTGEGVVHTCSKNYFHQHLDLFLAHDGPMYNIVHSPFCNKLFLTCGDDWAIRLWADTISEPLFEIKKKMAGVQGVSWSPSHSTIIASISGSEIFVWDLQRKTYDSQSTTNSPTKSRNTIIEFTHDGRCLLVADIDGNVHVFALDDMPFPAFFQENLLTQSIKRALVTRPDLLNRIDKLGSLNYDSAQYEKYK